MRGTELVTFLQLESEETYARATELDIKYTSLNDHYDIMQSVVSATAVLTDLDGAVDVSVPSTTGGLLLRLRAGSGRSVSVAEAFGHRGLALLTNDNRVAITMGTHGVLESDGEGVSKVLQRLPGRYISAFLIPGVSYPPRLNRLPYIYPKWPTTTISGTIEEL